MKVYLLVDFQVLDCKKHIIEEYPYEACGVIIKGKYYRCKNIAENPEYSFIMDTRDLSNAMDIGTIEYIIHSHINDSAKASLEDIRYMSYFSANWIIYSCTNNKITEKKVYDRFGKEIQS